jgi:hypothetical protein
MSKSNKNRPPSRDRAAAEGERAWSMEDTPASAVIETVAEADWSVPREAEHTLSHE